MIIIILAVAFKGILVVWEAAAPQHPLFLGSGGKFPHEAPVSSQLEALRGCGNFHKDVLLKQ